MLGSDVGLKIDGVNVGSARLPFAVPLTQVGIYCSGTKDVIIRDFSINSRIPQAFVVMQFSQTYDELYNEVVKGVCKDFGIESVRADDHAGPGLIVGDIVQGIRDAFVVIAEISPSNPNVYYEVGYAHALDKPTILIAEKGTKLPFDVAPFRVLFYENSIAGKGQIEIGLRKHLTEIVRDRGSL